MAETETNCDQRGHVTVWRLIKAGPACERKASGSRSSTLSLQALNLWDRWFWGGWQNNAMKHGAWGVGRLEQHCPPIFSLQPHPSRRTLPEEEVRYPRARLSSGGDFQTQPTSSVKWQSNESQCRWPRILVLIGLTLGNGDCVCLFYFLFKPHYFVIQMLRQR